MNHGGSRVIFLVAIAVSYPDGLVDCQPDEPTAKLSFVYKREPDARGCGETGLYNPVRVLLRPDYLTCNVMQESLAPRKSG